MTDIPRNIQERIATRLVGRERQVLEMRLGIGMARGQTLAEIGDSHLANTAGDQIDEPERNIAKAIVMSERKRLELDTSAPLEIEAPQE